VFGLFKGKPPVYPTNSKWAVLQGQHGGKPMFARRNQSAGDFAGHPDYRFRVGVAVPLNAPNERGFPGPEETEQLTAIEDSLVSRLESEQRSLHVLAITTGGMREFVFYTRDRAYADGILKTLGATVSSHKPQAYIAEDPKWGLYKQFA
jgi:hypothetical protein